MRMAFLPDIVVAIRHVVTGARGTDSGIVILNAPSYGFREIVDGKDIRDGSLYSSKQMRSKSV